MADYRVQGRVLRCEGLRVTCEGLAGLATVGSACLIETRRHNHDECSGTQALLAEVVGVDGPAAHLLPLGELDGVAAGAPVVLAPTQAAVHPSRSWLGRVLDPLARPLDAGPPLERGGAAYPLSNRPPPPHRRRSFGPRLELGVRALDLFTPCARGQRMGIFAGSGVGKSTLLGRSTLSLERRWARRGGRAA